MIKKIVLTFAALFASLFIGIIVVFSQDTESSSLITYLEEQISSPSYQIRLNGLKGSLSSDVSLESITISDEDGIWLQIDKPKLVWTRTALLTGRLVIDTMEAEHINFIRRPLPEKNAATPEASSFQIPELPVAVVLNELNFPLVEFGPDVINQASKTSVEGKIIIDEGSVDLDLRIERLDDVGGELNAIVQYNGGAETLALDVTLNEPENGIVASALGLAGRPPVALSIKGDAPLAELDVILALDVDQKRVLDGLVKFNNTDLGLNANGNLSGPLATLLPKRQRAFFGEKSELLADIVFLDAGGIHLKSANLKSGTVQLNATAKTATDGFLSMLKMQAGLEALAGKRVELPDQASSVQSAQLNIDYDAAARNTWSGTLQIQDFVDANISFGTIGIDAFGTVLNIEDQLTREISFDIDGLVSQIIAKDPVVTDAIGKDIKLQFDGDWKKGTPLQISRLNLLGETYRLLAKGVYNDNRFDGEIAVNADNLDSFSAITNTNLGGRIDLAARGEIFPFKGGFNLNLDGTSQAVKTGNSKLDALFDGITQLSGGVGRTVDGLIFENLLLTNTAVSATIDGRLASDFANISAQAVINDLARLSDSSTGSLTFDIALQGEQSPFDINAKINVPEGQLARQKVQNLALVFQGKTDGRETNGGISSDGLIGGQEFIVLGALNINEQVAKLQSLSAQIGATKIIGAFERDNLTGLMQAVLDVDSQDISAIAALALIDASGSVNGDVVLEPAENTQAAKLNLRLSGLRTNGVDIDSAEAIVRAADILAQPKINADINAIGIKVSGVSARNASLKVKNSGIRTDFDLAADLRENAARITSSGYVEQGADLINILVEKLQLKSNIANAQLANEARISVNDEIVRIEPTLIKMGSGSVEISGTAGEQLNLTALAKSVPLKLINSVQSGLNASGTLDANVKVTGRASAPQIAFNIDGQSVSVKQLQQVGLTPLALAANGNFSNNLVTLNRFSAQNAQSLALNGSGQIPLSGGALNVNVNGTAPLSLAERFLIERGTQIDGIAQLSARISGSTNNPVASGNISVDGATIIDPLSNIRINGGRVRIALNNSNQADLSFRGNLASGGSVSADGNIGLSGNLPANINVKLTSAKYGDGETFTTTVNGDLLVSGELSGSPLLSGDIILGRTEITVPESFASEANLLDVEHVATTTKVQNTLNRIAQATPSDGANGASGQMRLSLNINAPNQIFVRGRGLDAELGGRLGLNGSLDNIVPVGSFSLRRGRLSILGQRLDLTEGSITLAGDLDPVLNFLATTDTGDTLASIRLQGRASNLKVSFSSNPELPEDEVLAKIIFGRNITELSPAQIVRLASIATELTGGNSPSLIDSLRSGTGLDDVDLVQDDDGNAAVKAGKYISDNIYLGVQAGKETEATINLDITDSLKATGSVDSNGQTTLGIFFEKDY